MQVGNLEVTQVQALSPAALSVMSTQQLTGFTPTQLSGLSSRQVQAMTPSQLSSLSPAQASILVASGALSAVQTQALPRAPLMDAPQVAQPQKVMVTVSTDSATLVNPVPFVLSINVMGGTTSGAVGVRVAPNEQSGTGVQLQMTDTSNPDPAPPKLADVYYTTVKVRNASGEEVRFLGAINDGKLVISAGTASAREMVRTDLPNMLSSVIRTLAGDEPIALDTLKGVVLDVR